jgi:(p)ppGpp synthase/HD superfamily hydrolase
MVTEQGVQQRHPDVPLAGKIKPIMRPIEEALKFAEGRHAGQLYGDQPYLYHINGVVAIARSLGLNETVQVSRPA